MDDKIKIENIKRYDIKTRAIILIIDELNLNNEFRWIEGKVFKEYEKKILKEKNKDIPDIQINNLYKEINYDIEDLADNDVTSNNNNNMDIETNEIINEYSKDEIKEKEESNSSDDNEIDINHDNDINLNENDKNNEAIDESLRNYNLLELYEEITNNIDKININNNKSKNLDLRKRIKNKIIRNGNEDNKISENKKKKAKKRRQDSFEDKIDKEDNVGMKKKYYYSKE